MAHGSSTFASAARALLSAAVKCEAGTEPEADATSLQGTVAVVAARSTTSPGTKMSTLAKTAPMLFTCMALPACEDKLRLVRNGDGSPSNAILNIDDPPAATT